MRPVATNASLPRRRPVTNYVDEMSKKKKKDTHSPYTSRQVLFLCSKCPADGDTLVEKPAAINKTCDSEFAIM
jgi:hypothetical protein